MSHDVNDLEGRLRALAPANPALDREATLYRMGRASAPPRWPWQAASLVAALVAVGLGVAWWQERGRPPVEVVRVVERVVEVPVPTPVPTPSPPEPIASAWSPLPPDQPFYLRLQDQLLRHGLDGLLSVPDRRPAGRTPTRAELLQEMGFLSEGGS